MVHLVHAFSAMNLDLAQVIYTQLEEREEAQELFQISAVILVKSIQSTTGHTWKFLVSNQ